MLDWFFRLYSWCYSRHYLLLLLSVFLSFIQLLTSLPLNSPNLLRRRRVQHLKTIIPITIRISLFKVLTSFPISLGLLSLGLVLLIRLELFEFCRRESHGIVLRDTESLILPGVLVEMFKRRIVGAFSELYLFLIVEKLPL